jgi:O-antigen/teichoic acid export membrane protein
MNENKESEEEKINDLSKDQKILAKNTVYSIFTNYSGYFFALLTSLLMARLITKELWDYLILATSIINISSAVLIFLPPSLGLSYNYYIPKYSVLNQNTKLKSFIRISIFIRILFVLSTFIANLMIFLLLPNLFRINLENYFHLLFILAPFIIINGLDLTLHEINRSFNHFNIVYLFILIKHFSYFLGLLFCFLFINDVQIELIALISTITALIPFVINSIYTYIFLKFKIKNTIESKITLKETVKALSGYGSQLSIKTFAHRLSREFRIQALGVFESQGIVTGYNIANHYREVSSGSVTSLSRPLTISFSGLYSQKKNDQIEKMYNISVKYSIFLVLLINGLMYIFADLFLYLIYGESFVEFSYLLKVMTIIIIFGVQINSFYSLLRASESVKYIIPFSLFEDGIKILAFLIGLIYFGVIGALIGVFIGNLIMFILILALSFKIFNIKITILKLLSQYALFFVSLGITLILEHFFLNAINNLILQALHLDFLQRLNFLSIFMFLAFYLFLNIVLRVFTVYDIEKLEALFSKSNFIHKTVRKVLSLLRKFVKK